MNIKLQSKTDYKDFYYGRALRIADELGCWDAAVWRMMFFTSVEEYREYCVELENKLDEQNLDRRYAHERDQVKQTNAS